MKKLKVALVSPTHAHIHSSLQNALKTYEYLMKHKRVDVTIFTDSGNELSHKGFKVRKIQGVDYGTIWAKVLFVLGIPRFYYRNLDDDLAGFDVIRANNPEFYGYAYQAFKTAQKHNTRFVLQTSQTKEGFFLYSITKYIINPIVKKAYDYAYVCLFTNPEARARALRLRLIDENKRTDCIGHATDISCFRPKRVRKNKVTVILSVGGLYKIKGHHLIMKACKRLIDKGRKNLELWIVGEGYYRRNLEKQAKVLLIENKVKFLGAKGHAELASIYNHADIFVLANYQEITPAVNEALACEKPVVVMECGGRDFVLPSEDFGLISKPFDVEDMAYKIQLLLDNPKRAKKMAKRGRAHIVSNFSIEKVAEKLYRAFTQ